MAAAWRVAGVAAAALTAFACRGSRPAGPARPAEPPGERHATEAAGQGAAGGVEAGPGASGAGGAASAAGGVKGGGAAGGGDRRPADPARVAVLLPLSGRRAAIGREMRLAMEIAAGFDAAGGEDQGDREGGRARGPRPVLRFHDTRGDEREAVRQVDRAAAERAVGVIGPVGQAEARAAAARAAEHGLPIGLLAPDQGGAAPAAGAFRLWPSAEWEAAEAARLAVGLGHGRVAVLHPRDAQGQAQADAFRRAALAAGAQVIAVGGYDPKGAGLEADIRRFLGLDPAVNQRLRRHLARHGRKAGWKSFSPDVDFDLLYIPDEHGPAALVAAYLPYFNVELRDRELVDALSLRGKHGGRIPAVVQLLGSSGWYHPGLAARGGDAVEGALVVVPCAVAGGAADQSSDEAADFAERFEARAGHPPGPLAAQAHDAARLFLAARAEAAGARDPRPALAAALRAARLRDGACGPAHIGPDGQLWRAASLLQMEGGELVPFAR